MLLAVDVGNTHSAFGVFRGNSLAAQWRVTTHKGSTTDELRVLVHGLFRSAGLRADEVSGMIVSSVVPDLDDALRQLGGELVGRRPLFVGPGVRTGVPILYENPHEVGADRIVNAAAAVERFGAPVIVLDFGTATTFDVVSAKGEYLGGVIAPGLNISAEALFARAARLVRVEPRKPQRIVGRNTTESIQSGLFYGYVGLVEGLVTRIRAELGHQAPVVATGGLARIFERELQVLAAVEPGLTLEGLRLIWERNAR